MKLHQNLLKLAHKVDQNIGHIDDRLHLHVLHQIQLLAVHSQHLHLMVESTGKLVLRAGQGGIAGFEMQIDLTPSLGIHFQVFGIRFLHLVQAGVRRLPPFWLDPLEVAS